MSISNKGGSTSFFDRSTADASISNEEGGTTNFFDRSAADASISNSAGGTTNFFDRSTAGNSTIFTSERFSHVGGSTNFFNRSSAGNSTIRNQVGSVFFANNSTAGSAFIDLDRSSFLQFTNNSTAANSTITTFNDSRVQFLDNSTAGSASIGVVDGTFLNFFDNSTAASASIDALSGVISFGGSSRGGTAQIDLRSLFVPFDSELDISGHNAPGVTIGSLAGNEGFVGGPFVDLGANNLTVGSNNLSTAFAGVIRDGGLFGDGGGTGGSLTKIGTGTLTLTGANTYTGNTNINRGVLQVDGSITSNTFVNHGGTLAGTGTINGNVMNNGKVSPGALGAPGVLTVVHNYTQAQYATLMIQIAGASTGQFSVLDVMGSANLNGFLDPVLLNGFVPSIGESFTFLNYASFTGEFSQILNQVFNHGTEQWSVTYQNNNAILTVESHTPGVPDHGSTFLLLMVGLLGLVTYRRQLLRGQP